MIPGVEGLALIAFIPLALVGLALLGLGILLLLGAGVARMGRKPYARRLGWAGAGTGGLAAVLLLIFGGVAMKARSYGSRRSPPAHQVTLAMAFDLRTARTFEALGLAGQVDKSTSPLDGTLSQRVALAGDLTVDAIVTDRLRYRGKLTSLMVNDGADDDPLLIRTVWMETAPLPREECARLAGASKDLGPGERADLELWRTNRLEGELSFTSPYERKPQVSAYLPSSKTSSATCVLTLAVAW